MKKLISVLLVGFLLLSMIVVSQGIAEEPSQVYYLWDIPFGISESEFIEQVYAKTGFNFVPHSGEAEESFQIFTDEKQSISFLGHPLNQARTIFQVDSEGGASYYALALFFNVENKTIPEVLSLFDSVCLVLQEKYGDHTFAALSNDRGDFFTCDAIEGGFDARQVTNILATDDTIRAIELSWNNLGVYVSKTSGKEVDMVLYALAYIVEASEPLEAYENRNAPSDAGL